MITIHLNNLSFYAYHGVHEEERIIGGAFEMHISVTYNETDAVILRLHQTINYVTLYEIVKKRMSEPTLLLETVIMEIANSFMAQFSMIESVQISITKIHPPIVNFQGSVGVSFLKHRNSK